MSDSFATPWIVACQAPLSLGFSRQEYRSRFPFSSPGDLPDPGIEPTSPALEMGSLPLSHLESPRRCLVKGDCYCYHDCFYSKPRDHAEKAMATHSSLLAWRIPGTGEPGGLPSMGSHRVGHG